MVLGHTWERQGQQRKAPDTSLTVFVGERATSRNLRKLVLLLPLLLLAGCGSHFASTDPTGPVTKYGVQLKWDAPGGSDPAASYNVYRELAGSTIGYTQVNTSPIAAVSYTDKNVQVGVSYTYVVRAVDAGGGESDPSNSITVTIPSN